MGCTGSIPAVKDPYENGYKVITYKGPSHSPLTLPLRSRSILVIPSKMIPQKNTSYD